MKNLKYTLYLVPILLASAPLITHLSPIYAAESTLTGINIPRNGARFNSDQAQFTGVLTTLAGEKAVALKPTGDSPEVWAWKGDAFRADRIKFTMSGVSTALEAAGYTVQEIGPNDIRDTNIFNFFDSNDDSVSFKPASSPAFFRASNPSKGRAFVAAWIASDDALTLSMLPVEFKAKPKAKPLPSIPANTILVKNIDDTGASLRNRPLPAFAPLARKPRTIRGWLKDAGGRPVSGAEVAVYSSIGGGFRTTHKGFSNAQGLYEVLLPTGIAEVAQVEKKITYGGQTFPLKLEPVSGVKKQFNSQNGHVENYILRAQGKAGGTVRILDNFSSGVVEVTLTPVGRLMDGSIGPTLIYRYKATEFHAETYLNGMPIGNYKVNAKLLDDGEVLPVRVRNTFGNDQTLRSSLPIKFEAGFTYSSVNINKSNFDVAYVQITLEP